ncbi:3-dehydroshikimate dehydratase [bacterium HR17]|uniref:3-dehydroshikimate dehydratase n=1 Tax=Candidatus Fervidibacter japonicus TaxID=2035412 RepID=A0A2H5XBF9_9BACT|nr:3-dehydroshikimate dehydratase [bacterium HR17]
MRLAFMTWACPQWTVDEIVAAARRYGYDGVEFRLSVGHRHGVEVDMSEERKLAVRRLFKTEGLTICCLASGARLFASDPAERRRTVEQVKAEIELAADLDCPCVRVFGGTFPATVAREDAHRSVADSLRQLGEFAAPHRVVVGLETHDAFSRAADAAETVRAADHPQVGIVWDIRHPLAQGETMADAFEQVKPFVRHCHFGDRKRVNGQWQFAHIGEGEVPVAEAVALLRSIGYSGFLSFEAESFGDLDADTLLREYADRLRAILAAEAKLA